MSTTNSDKPHTFSEEAYKYAEHYLSFMEEREKEFITHNISNSRRNAMSIMKSADSDQNYSVECKMHQRMFALADFLCMRGEPARRLWDLLHNYEHNIQINDLKKEIDFLRKACDEREERIIELHDILNSPE